MGSPLFLASQRIYRALAPKGVRRGLWRIRRLFARLLIKLIYWEGLDLSEMREVIVLRYRDLRFKASVSNGIDRWRWEEVLARRKEPEVIDWIDAELRPDEIFVDIGANIGNYAIYSGLRHPGLRIYAFEPEPHSFIQLVTNATLNGLSITAFLMPLSDQPRVDFLNVNNGFTAGQSIHQFGRTHDEHGLEFVPLARIGLASTSLDALVEARRIPCPNHVKIDVDGIERTILNGMRSILSNRELKSLCIEINGQPAEIDGAVEFLLAYGFTCTHRPPPRAGFNDGNYVFKRTGLPPA